MKFLVIGKPNGNSHDLTVSSQSLESYAKEIDSHVSGGKVEAAFAIISGGYVLIVSAKDTKELALIVRNNPLFKSSHTEITPIADAVDFLRGFKGFV